MTNKDKIESLLWEAMDLMSATLERPDPRIWSYLWAYHPKRLDLRILRWLTGRSWQNNPPRQKRDGFDNMSNTQRE